MEIREIESIANKSDYAEACLYVKQIESINLSQLYRALTFYLSFLTLPDIAQYLEIYQTHLLDPYSWLNKAHCLSQAETQRELARTRAQTAHSTLDQTLWEDLAKKLNYLIENWDTNIYSSCQQIIHGVSVLIKEHVPLHEVQAEIIAFAEERGVFPPVIENAESLTLQLERLLCDASINSCSVLLKLSRTLVVQADLFLKRLMQTEIALDSLDIRRSFLFEANYKLCEFIKTQSQGLQDAINRFPLRLATKITKKLNGINVDAILQRYQDCAVPFATQKNNDVDIGIMQHELKNIQVSTIPQLKVSHDKIQQQIVVSEQLLENITEKIALHRLQLSCLSHIKSCYNRFSVLPIFRKIAMKFTQYQTALKESLSELTLINKSQEMAAEWNQKLSTLADALNHCLACIATYLNTLKVHDADYNIISEIPDWQTRLHNLILNSSTAELAILDSRLQRIEAMDSPYLRATLVIKLDVAKLRLNDMIIANMQSWSSRLVDRETVVKTLSYLGIYMHPSHLNKVAPNMQVVPKKKVSRQGLYSSVAVYGERALKNVCSWLDKEL